MKFLITLVILIFASYSMAGEFERGYNAGLKACQRENYYLCSANTPMPNLVRRSTQRAMAIDALYNYCESPSGRNSNVRYECELILKSNAIKCKEL